MGNQLNQLLIKRARLKEKLELLHRKKLNCQSMFFRSKSSKEQYYWSTRLEAIQSIMAELDQEYDEIEELFIKSAREIIS